jgi:hypothetical protein
MNPSPMLILFVGILDAFCSCQMARSIHEMLLRNMDIHQLKITLMDSRPLSASARRERAMHKSGKSSNRRNSADEGSGNKEGR